MKHIAFMFPGQGSQAVGMGKLFYDEYPEVQKLYEQANNVLNKDIRALMFEGPEELLTETENAQPALLLASTAIHTLLMKEGIKPAMTVGHSLGESEEHTSELQSRFDLVCRLLLEKNKFKSMRRTIK